MPKLTVELIPSSCHYSNVRTTVTTTEWDKIRKLSYISANNQCEICKSTGKQQGYKHNVECHEIWEYNDTDKIQKLIGLVSLCPICHLTKHIGRAIAMGKASICHKQLAKVNKWTPTQIKQHILDSFKLHKERSRYKWSLDLSILNSEPYNLNIDTTKQRIFEVKTYKKKKKKKSLTPKINKRPPKQKKL